MTTRPIVKRRVTGSAQRLWAVLQDQLTGASFKDVMDRLGELLLEKDNGGAAITGEDMEDALSRQARHNGHVETAAFSVPPFIKWVGYGS